MEHWTLTSYMIRSRQEHIRHAAASLRRSRAARRTPAWGLSPGLSKAVRSSLSRLLVRCGRLLVEAGSAIAQRSAFAPD